ncbi:MAG: hypothetical protein KAV25_07565, partial [Methanophagales archaeon]|nr:hypothetical protein [Methanophagales archaeon]
FDGHFGDGNQVISSCVANVKNHEISRDEYKKMKLGFMMQDTECKFRDTSCILYFSIFNCSLVKICVISGGDKGKRRIRNGCLKILCEDNPIDDEVWNDVDLLFSHKLQF